MENSLQNQSHPSLDKQADELLIKVLDSLQNIDFNTKNASEMIKRLNVMNAAIRLVQARTRLKNNLKRSAMSLLSGLLGGGLCTALLNVL